MENLKRPDVLLVFTYAPAGLGHLRVTDALYNGLQEGINLVLLGSDDTRITYWHRLMSVDPFIRRVMEWFQQEKHEQWFDRLYIWVLRATTKHLYQQMEHLIIQQWNMKKTVVVVSTHFGLAHQLAKIKNRLEKNLKIKLILVVQVTDATSMKIWYVEGADLICVPSEKVRREFANYAQKKNLRHSDIVVLPYPLSKTMGSELSGEEYNFRLEQYSGDSSVKINIVMPISGAAVGLNYYDKIIAKLTRSSKRFRIFLVIKDNIYTTNFIRKMKTREQVTVIANTSDKEVVDSYDKVYQKEIIALEIVKPSEQSFKALFNSSQRGGAILLLTEAIGKQEQDNLNFLLDHQLLPERAIKLTNDPDLDVETINSYIKEGLFKKMASQVKENLQEGNELATNGVQQFWAKVDALVEKERMTDL